MSEEIQEGARSMGGKKASPQARDRLQSRVLVAMVGGWLVLESLSALRAMYQTSHKGSDFVRLNVEIVAISVAFALIVLRLRAATPVAAAFGGMICLILLWGTALPNYGLMRSGL